MVETFRDAEATEFYLDAIGAPGAVRLRVRDLLDMYSQFLDLREMDIFASESIDAEGNRTFQSVWVFTEAGAFEAEITAESGNQLDGTAIKNRIIHWVARAQDFNFEVAFPTSRLSLEVSFSDQLIGELRATGPNCLRLVEMLKKYIVPNAK